MKNYLIYKFYKYNYIEPLLILVQSTTNIVLRLL